MDSHLRISRVFGLKNVMQMAALLAVSLPSLLFAPPAIGQALPHPIDLAEVGVGTVPGVRIEGIDTTDHSGRSVSGVGDVNGDGLTDILIGAPRDILAGNTGESYLVYGSSSGIGTGGALNLDTLNGTTGVRIDGINIEDFSGGCVSGVGDVNGDSYDDFIIGARGADPGGNDHSGESYLIYGSPNGIGVDGVLDLALLDGINGVQFKGIERTDHSGIRVAGAGDFNGDGFSDFLIAAYPEGISSKTGEVYLIYGSPSGIGASGVIHLADLDGTNGICLVGIYSYGQCGSGVSGVGDVNGDGFADILIGDKGKGIETGEAYLVYGSPLRLGVGGKFLLSDLNDDLGVTFRAIQSQYDSMGGDVSGAGDINGDGLADFLIGAHNGGHTSTYSNGYGEVYLIYGSSVGIGSEGRLLLSTLDGFNGIKIRGIARRDYAEICSGAGDINGDGFDDLLIGAAYTDSVVAENTGETYLIYGSSAGIESGNTMVLSTLDGLNGVRLSGIDEDDYSGCSVSGAGDVNYDGFHDFLIGAWGADVTSSFSAGETYLIYGSGEGLPGTSRPGDCPRTGIGRVDGSNNIPTTRVWVDFDSGDNGSGGPSRETVNFHPSSESNFVPLQVEPIFEWDISTNRVNYGTADITFKGLGVRGELDWGGLILTTDDAGASWYAPAQTSASVIHEVTATDVALPRQFALAVVPDTSPPQVIDAVLSDADDNGVADPGESLTLIMDRGVIVRSGLLNPSSFTLPVAEDSLGETGFFISVNPFNSRLIEITLGVDASLTIPGAFASGSSSGIGIADGLSPTAIQSLYGVPALSAPPVDIDYTLVPDSTTIGAGGGTVMVTDSPDAAYTMHTLTIPPGSIPTASGPHIQSTNFTMQPPPENLGEINAVQVTASNPTITFANPATLTLEYRESDIDVEMGQSEDSMRIFQLIEVGPSLFTWSLVPGEQTRDTETNTVEVEISNLNPAGSSGDIGIFATVPVNPITEATIPINPVDARSADHTAATLHLSPTANPVLIPDPDSHYTGHAIEFPGYAEVAPAAPNRIDVTIRSATIYDRGATGGRVSFPTQSAAVFAIETTNASGQPVEFTDPVNITGEFVHGSERSDVMDFTGAPHPPARMRLAHDTIDGPLVNFEHWEGAQTVTLTATGGIVRAEGVVGLTDSRGKGTWGTVALAAETPELADILNYLLGLSFNPAGLDMDGDHRVTSADLVTALQASP